MASWDHLKRELYDVVIENPSRESKYGEFLNKLVFEDDRRGKDPLWDLWYLSDNTEFCRRSMRHYSSEIVDQLAEYARLEQSFQDNEPGESHFSFDKLRMLIGSLFFYQFSALESFAHEVNLFYGLGLKRGDVSLIRVRREMARQRPGRKLAQHIKVMEAKDKYNLSRSYRNAAAHGHVFPIHGSSDSILVPVKPKHEPFSFDGDKVDLRELVQGSTTLVDEYICLGWRCFEHDELSRHPGTK